VELGAAYLPIGCNQGSSGLIRLCGTRRGLPAHRMQSGLIRAHQGPSVLIGAHQCSSGLIRKHQGQGQGNGSVFTLGSHSEVFTCPSPSASQLRKRSSTRAEFARSALASCSAIRDAIREAVRKAIRDAIWEAIARRVRPEVQIGANRKAIRDAIWEAISAPSSTEARSRAIGGASTAINGHQRSSVLIRTHQSSDQRSSVLISAH
jgi:hypothetical protein